MLVSATTALLVKRLSILFHIWWQVLYSLSFAGVGFFDVVKSMPWTFCSLRNLLACLSKPSSWSSSRSVFILHCLSRLSANASHFSETVNTILLSLCNGVIGRYSFLGSVGGSKYKALEGRAAVGGPHIVRWNACLNTSIIQRFIMLRILLSSDLLCVAPSFYPCSFPLFAT